MLTISVRQPYAWMIIHTDKDVENRDWPTNVCGRVLIHAAKTITQDEWCDAFALTRCTGELAKARQAGITRRNIERGGIIGSVEIYACVTQSSSRWFRGKYGFLLRNPKPLPFAPWRGQLRFFDVPVIQLPAETRFALQETTP